jgi:hypothetical protein
MVEVICMYMHTYCVPWTVLFLDCVPLAMIQITNHGEQRENGLFQTLRAPVCSVFSREAVGVSKSLGLLRRLGPHSLNPWI